MYLLYLDDSGSVSNRSEEYFVLGGICVPERSIRWLSHELELIAEEIDSQNPTQVEFHAAAMFSGKQYPWNNFSQKQDRINIIKKVLGTVGRCYPDTVVFACAIHKASFRGTDPVLAAFEQLSSRFDMYIQRQIPVVGPQKGMIIIDETTYEEGLQNLAADIRRIGNRWGRQLRNICEVPLFVDSRAARIIQLADHIAYAVFRRYNANDLTYYNCIESRFDQENGVIHGLVHHTYDHDCTCPACLTRRERDNFIRELSEDYSSEL